jgi:DNA-binding GntR family transcriptional regulator
VPDLHVPLPDTGDALTNIRTDSLSERVFEAIRTAIVTKSLPPGTRLTETYLAQQLDVSKTPVREALLRLREIGLIEPDGRRGGRVIRASRDVMVSAYEVREALEVFAARTAAMRATDEQRKEIAATAERSLQGARDGDEGEFGHWDTLFHTHVTNVLDNPRLTALLDGTFALIVSLRTRDLPKREDSIACGEAHVLVAEAIAAGDEDAAERGMREHIHYVRDFVLQMVEAGG